VFHTDNVKTAPNPPNTFEPNRIVRGNHPLWAPFYNPGRTRLGDDGTVKSDPNHPPHFRVSRELLGRMLHTFKKGYVDEDEQRKTSALLSDHIRRETERLTGNVSRAAEMLQRRKDDLQKQHDEAMAASHQHVLEVSRAYKEAIGKHTEALQLSVQGTHVLAQGLKDEARKLKDVIVSSDIVPSLELDGKELGYVKQLKELHRVHSELLLEHKRLQESKEGVVKQLHTAREVNRETSQVIADLEERNKFLGQDKLELELMQRKLEKEFETLKRKRRSTPSPPPAKLATTPKLRILQRGEKESTAEKESTLSPSSLPPTKKSRSRAKRWDQPAPGHERKVPSPARTPDNVNGKRKEEQNVKDDPVLHAPLNSFRYKKDVEEEIRRSSKALRHGSKSSEEVFQRRTIAHQRKVITKVNAYVEVIIADTCKHRAHGDRGTTSSSSRNPVHAYLSGLTLLQVRELHAEVQAALGDVMDTNRLMSTYSLPGPEHAGDSLEGCFFQASKNLPSSSPLLSPKGPYRSTDDNRALHQRLAIHNRHYIPIGFYYSKWLEKLRFHLDNREEERVRIQTVRLRLVRGLLKNTIPNLSY
jgi:hypothetical protein